MNIDNINVTEQSKDPGAQITGISEENSRSAVSFTVAEAYKTIRTNIKFLLNKKTGNIFTVSGSDVGEGKSTTAINIAVAFSQLGEKVLLIDADLRRSSVHKKLHLENKTGLSEILADFTDFESCVQSAGNNLDVLASGHTAPNPSELLGSLRFKSLLDELGKKYKYIIIDTPPIGIVSDPLVVASNTDGIVLVARCGYTVNDMLKQAIEAVEFAKVKVLGVVLNAADIKNSTKYSKRKYSYRKKYYRYYKKYGN